MLKSYKDLKVRQKSYELCLEISYGSVCELETQILLAGDLDLADKVFRKQTLESLTPGILGPSSPTILEKNLKK